MSWHYPFLFFLFILSGQKSAFLISSILRSRLQNKGDKKISYPYDRIGPSNFLIFVIDILIEDKVNRMRKRVNQSLWIDQELIKRIEILKKKDGKVSSIYYLSFNHV